MVRTGKCTRVELQLTDLQGLEAALFRIRREVVFDIENAAMLYPVSKDWAVKVHAHATSSS